MDLVISPEPQGASRRDVLISVVVGGVLMVGAPADVFAAAPAASATDFGPFIKIAPDGSVIVVSKHLEMGQGVHAGLAAIVAEELDADWTKVGFEHSRADSKVYANSLMGSQGTGGSSSISNSWTQLRQAGAGARAMFVQAAAAKWKVPAAEITVKDSVVSHARSGKHATFAELLPDAAKQTPPAAPALKDPKDFTLIGKDLVRRKDSYAKSTGTARFTQDVHLDGMLIAVVAHPPRFGGKVASFDATEAKKAPGVVDVVAIPSGVAVLAQNTWAARKGREALKVVWDESKAEKRSSDAILAEYKALASGAAKVPAPMVFEAKGDAALASAGANALEVAFDFPFIAHAPMEPMNCVAQVNGTKVKLIYGSQFQGADQNNAAKVVGGTPAEVEIETIFAGGSFGRRANFDSDFIVEAVQIARQVPGKPVKLVWTREDDMMGGYYRPMTHHALRITTDTDGYPAAWRHRIVSKSILAGTPFASKDPDFTAIEGAKGSPYLAATPVVDGQVSFPESPVPVLWWRSVGATHTAFVMEHTIDQLALKAGKDPAAYRQALYEKAGEAGKRHLGVLKLVTEKAQWGKVMPAGTVQGLAVHECFGSVVAQVAEVALVDGVPKVTKVVSAIDCGIAISPSQIEAQVQGGTCFGLSAALFGAITLKDGIVEQSNFDTYRVLRNSEAPVVEVHIVPSANAPTGVGEPGTPVIAPAVANALLKLTGKATTALPFVKT
jgi:isoquinoline 1-oxidoreductase beta subunit